MSQSVNAAAERCVNFYPEPIEVPTGKVPLVLYPTPGYTSKVTLPDSPNRGHAAFDGRLFAVAGTHLYEVDSLWGVVDRGTVANDLVNSPATFSTNGDAGGQLFVTAGGTGYILTLATNVLTTVLTGTAHFGGFVDGYFLALDTTTSTLRVSALENGLTWDPTMVAQRNTAADPWVSMTILGRQVRLMGQLTSEAWYDAGDPLFPFAPVQDSLVDHGIASPYSSAALADESVIWLSANRQGTGVVMRASGYTPTRISSHAVEQAIQGYYQTRDAVAWSYQDRGHPFYVLAFPTAGATWVYDTVTGFWHERGWWNSTTMLYNASRAQFHAYVFGLHLVGDRLTGVLYEQSITAYTDIASGVLRRLRQGPHLSSQQRQVFASTAQLDLETGIGTVATPAPQVMLQWSVDGGHLWSNEHWVTAGAVGAYRMRAIWRRIGVSRDRIFRVVVTDPVPWRLLDFFYDGEVGTT